MATILLVDDDAAFRVAAARMINGLGHAARVVASAREAYAALREERPDLVLLDVYMPEEDGLEALGRLTAECPGLRVVMMTGGGALLPELTLTVAKRLGALDTLPKPFTRDELADAIRRVVDQPGPEP